jgi:hypothetical protein
MDLKLLRTNLTVKSAIVIQECTGDLAVDL